MRKQLIYKKKHGFTFIELIIIITIIAILVALTVYAFKGIRASARRTACMNNSSTIWRALMLYVDDWNVDTLPDGSYSNLREWYGALYYPQTDGKMGGITQMDTYVCPATKHTTPATNGYGAPLIIDATNGNGGYHDPSFTGSNLDYWLVKRQVDKDDKNNTRNPLLKTMPSNNVLLIEPSLPSLSHHSNGRTITFRSGKTKFIKSFNALDYPVNLYDDGTPQTHAGTTYTVAQAWYIHPAQ